MLKYRFGFLSTAAYTWVAIVSFGGIAMETIVIYPNVFHDPPSSLQQSGDFFVITGPADFFPIMGATTFLLGILALLLTWRANTARWWLSSSLASLFFGEYLYSMLYFWPRNEMMFDEGIAIHSVETLRQAAWEFEVGHWGRLAMSAVTASLAFTAMLRLHRDQAERRREV